MILKQDEKNVLEDLQADTDLQQMAQLGAEGSDHVDKWVSYYACEYEGLSDGRVFEILKAINEGEDFEIEGEEPEPLPWENPRNTYEENKREYQLSYGPDTYFEAGEEEL
jgi:hypothetical protein